MKILVTGSSGHLGEALVRTFQDMGADVIGLDIKAFVFTSTTSVFGDALRPPARTPAAWVTEAVTAIPKNICGVTKTAAEDLCLLFHRKHGLNCVILRTSRFFPEEDDNELKRQRYTNENAKANEFLFRRVELEDVVSAHIAAAKRAPDLGFGRYIISASTPFLPEDLLELNTDAAAVVRRRIPAYSEIYAQLGWAMFDKINRVYVNEAARKALDWHPKYDFNYVLQCLRKGAPPKSRISEQVGSKGYHDQLFKDGPYPV